MKEWIKIQFEWSVSTSRRQTKCPGSIPHPHCTAPDSSTHHPDPDVPHSIFAESVHTRSLRWHAHVQNSGLADQHRTRMAAKGQNNQKCPGACQNSTKEPNNLHNFPKGGARNWLCGCGGDSITLSRVTKPLLGHSLWRDLGWLSTGWTQWKSNKETRVLSPSRLLLRKRRRRRGLFLRQKQCTHCALVWFTQNTKCIGQCHAAAKWNICLSFRAIVS